jgi:Zn-dependent protease/CBS domain-containing protein
MFGRRITILKVFGFEVRLDASWIIIAALVIWSLATGIFPISYRGLPVRDYWLMGVVAALGFFGSIVLHEMSHSLVAKHYKLPMKGITLFIFGGVAEMGGEPESPKVEFLMAIAGPVASIVLGLIFFVVATAGQSGPTQVMGVVAYLAWINWILAGFNLIPAFPLDGGRVLRAALWHWKGDLIRATEVASRIGSGFGLLLMAFAIYQLFFGYLISAIWYFLIGTFLRGASQMSYQQVLLKSELGGEPVRRFMRPDPVTVRPDMTIRQLVEDYIYRYDFKVYPVVGESEELIGCVTTANVKEVPKEQWESRHVSEIVNPCTEANTVSPDTDALSALSKIRDTGASGLLVTERNHLLAIVSPRDLLNFLAAKMELEGRSATGLLAAPRI